MDTIDDKIERSVRLLRTFAGSDTVEIAYSGGKDSDVILELAKMAGISYRAIYKNTTIDEPGTIQHVLAMGGEIHRPKQSFLDIVKKKGMPSRRYRFCCEKLKEYKILDKCVIGVRRAESTSRAKRYSEDDPIVCVMHGRSRNQYVQECLPIVGWTNGDVEEFISRRGITCHPKYYDEDGTFHIERRIGCIGCPLVSDQGVSEFIKYPKHLKAQLRALRVWWDTHQHTKSARIFTGIYGIAGWRFMNKPYEQWEKRTKRIGGEQGWKVWLEIKFGIDLTLE